MTVDRPQPTVRESCGTGILTATNCRIQLGEIKTPASPAHATFRCGRDGRARRLARHTDPGAPLPDGNPCVLVLARCRCRAWLGVACDIPEAVDWVLGHVRRGGWVGWSLREDRRDLSCALAFK